MLQDRLNHKVLIFDGGLGSQLQKRGMKTRYFRSFQACRQEILCQSHDNTTFILLGAGDIVDLAYSFYH